MALYGLVDTTSHICQIAAATFPVAAPLAWTPDLSAVSPQPQVGWTAAQAAGVWSYTAPAAPTAPQQYAAALLAGVAITSTGTPALNGTYGITLEAQQKITSEQVYIATTGKFTNGQTTRGWPDAAGTLHTFPSTAEFTAFAEAVAGYVDALAAALAAAQAGGAWVAPAMPAALA